MTVNRNIIFKVKFTKIQIQIQIAHTNTNSIQGCYHTQIRSRHSKVTCIFFIQANISYIVDNPLHPDKFPVPKIPCEENIIKQSPQSSQLNFHFKGKN